MREDTKIIINGKEYEIVSYVTNELGNFIAYTDFKELGNGQIVLYVNRISKDNDEIIFEDVDDEELSYVINEIKERLISNE